MTNARATLSFLALSMLLGACGEPPPKSPTNDVQPPTTTTGSGEVMGADRVAPGQKLQEGPKLDSQDGIKPAETPPGD